MDGMVSVRTTLVELREAAKLSQAELSKRLPYTASRLSRLESGEIQLTIDEACEIAAKIGEVYPEANLLKDYLVWEWRILEKPGFSHISLRALRKAEESLQQLDLLLDDPEIKNAFVQQLRSCRSGILEAAAFLQDTEHGIAFIGPPRAGKTTTICALADLRDPSQKELGDQMVLQTGGGRVTVCEGHVRSGDEYSIIVDPSSHEEIRQFVAEFCEDLKEEQNGADGKTRSVDSLGLPAEVERLIRNMAGLPRPRSQKGPDGKFSIPEDPAVALAKTMSKDDLLVEIITRMELARRTRTSINYSRDSSATGLQWLKQTYREINFGLHPEFSLPRRVEVVVPKPILGATNLHIRLIDTRGNDEPAAPRRDLQNYFDDPRTLIVLCSSFGDAPDAASQALIERAAENSMQSPLAEKGLLLVLPQDKEERTVLNQSTGEAVGSEEEGRDIRRYETLNKLDRLAASYLRVGFLNALYPDDCAATAQTLLELIKGLRQRYEQRIKELATTVDDLLNNKETAESRAVLESAMKPLQVWFENHDDIADLDHDVESKLLRDMSAIRYASTLRASVNRLGSWEKFDYWLGLGLGTRQHTVLRTKEDLTGLKALVQNALDNQDLSEAHGFLRHFQNQVDGAIREFYQHVQTLGETAFSEQLRNDYQYWQRCQSRWGMGKGFKNDISSWTEGWFGANTEHRQERYQYIDAEVKRRWRVMLGKLSAQLQSDNLELTAKRA